MIKDDDLLEVDGTNAIVKIVEAASSIEGVLDRVLPDPHDTN